MANSILDLRIQYDSASQVIEDAIDSLPTEDGLELLDTDGASIPRIMRWWA